MTEPPTDDGADDAGGDADGEGAETPAVVLDFLARGAPDDDRPQYQRSPVVYALAVEEFGLYKLAVAEGSDVAIGDRIDLDPSDGDGLVVEARERIDYEDLPGGAQSELPYAVEEIVENDEQRFVDFFNDAQPITLRLHQLNLLPGIGKKLRNNVLDERKRKPFESFEDLEERVSGLHDPKGTLVDRIVEELRDEDLKYRIFVSEDGS